MDSQEAGATLTPAQQAMSDLWDEHMRSEFESQSVEDTLETMVEDDPYVNHVPVLTGGVGLDDPSSCNKNLPFCYILNSPTAAAVLRLVLCIKTHIKIKVSLLDKLDGS